MNIALGQLRGYNREITKEKNMPHAIWKGTISFGLVSIPVGLYSIEKSESLQFHFLHKKDMKPIKFARVHEGDTKPIPWEEIVRAYEYEKGKYVVLDDKDFKRADLELTRSVQICEFVNKKEIDPIYFDKPYILSPEKGGQHAYALLARVIRDTGKVGIAKVVIRNKQHLAAITERDGALMLELMHFAENIRPVKAVVKPPKSDFSKKEISMALSLLAQMEDSFKPEKYTDTYKKELLELIEKKAKGKLKAPKKGKKTKVEIGDLISELQESLKVMK